MDWLYTLLVWRLDWYWQVGIMVLIVGVPIYFVACMIFGTAVANRYVVIGVVAIATLGLASKLRQEGYKRRLEEEERANKIAEDVAAEERREAQGLPDVALNDKVDKWSK